MRVPRGLLIKKARIQGRLGGDAGAHRLRLAYLLERVDARPPGRPPSAILLVRSLGPLPGGGELGPLSGPGSGRLEAALQARLAEAWARAIRPQNGQVPPGADALWFLDEAEFSAFLALGRRERWWWEALPDPGGLFPLLVEHPERLPGALSHLVEWGEAGRILVQLSLPQTRQLLAQLRETFRIPEPPSLPTSEGDAPISRQRIQAPAPWEPPSLNEVLLQRLGAERGRLLRTALAVLRAPAVLRHRGESQALVEPEAPSTIPARPSERSVPQTEGGAHATNPTPVEGEVPPRPATNAPQPALAPAIPRGSSHLAEPSARTEPTAEGLPSPVADPAPKRPAEIPDDRPTSLPPPSRVSATTVESGQGFTGPAESRPVAPADPSAEPAATILRAVTEAAVSRAPELARPTTTEGECPSAPAAPPELAPRNPPSEEPLQTGLGGVLYLLNLLAHVDLPQRDEADWRLASGLGAGGLLRLLAGPLLPDTERDPLWALLAELDGIPLDQPLGSGMVEPRGTTPVVAAGGPAPWFSSTGQPLTTVLGQELAPPLQAWMHQGLPPLIETLTATLGLDLAAYLQLPGRLWLTTTHLDLELSLDQIALPIRLAGLDANPGWVPALGRVVSFHYR